MPTKKGLKLVPIVVGFTSFLSQIILRAMINHENSGEGSTKSRCAY